MNFDQESKSEDFFFFFFFGGGGGGGGRRGGGRGIPTKKNSRYLVIFCAHALRISSSSLKWFSSFNTNKRGNRQVRCITQVVNVSQNSVKFILTWILDNLLNFRILA